MSAAKKKSAPPVTTDFDLAPRPLPAPWHVERLLHGSVRLVANKEPGDEGFGDDVGFNCGLLDAHRVAAIEFAARAVNSHAALVEALRRLADAWESPAWGAGNLSMRDAVALARAAIALAEGSR